MSGSVISTSAASSISRMCLSCDGMLSPRRPRSWISRLTETGWQRTMMEAGLVP